MWEGWHREVPPYPDQSIFCRRASLEPIDKAGRSVPRELGFVGQRKVGIEAAIVAAVFDPHVAGAKLISDFRRRRKTPSLDRISPRARQEALDEMRDSLRARRKPPSITPYKRTAKATASTPRQRNRLRC